MRFFRYLILFCVFLSSLVHAGEFRVIDLQHRGAAEMADTIRPMLQADENVSVIGTQLILSASPQRLEMLNALVNRLDTVVHQFRISVRTGEQMAEAQQQIGVSGRGAGDHAALSIPPAAGDRPTVEVRDGQNVARISAESRSMRGTENVSQVLTVMEGYPAQIGVGESRPLPSYSVVQQGNRITEVRSQDYVAANSGFSVVARMQGDRVVLRIRPQSADFNARGGINTAGADTSVSVMPGQWFQLGGMAQEQNTTGRAILARQQGNSLSQSAIWLRVDVIK